MFMSAHETYESLPETVKTKIAVLVRGVAHSASARSDFNALCLSLGVVPNELLAFFRDSHGPQAS